MGIDLSVGIGAQNIGSARHFVLDAMHNLQKLVSLYCGFIFDHALTRDTDAVDALQFDWSKEHVVLSGVEQKIIVAHLRLCHSRKPFIVAYPGESQEVALDAFVRALSFYGGVPRPLSGSACLHAREGDQKDQTIDAIFAMEQAELRPLGIGFDGYAGQCMICL